MKSITEAYLKIVSPTEEPVVEEVQLDETTVPEKFHPIVDMWDHHSKVSDDTIAKMRNALRPYGNFTHFPLHDIGSDGDADVLEHLTKHGYQITDYRNGIASKEKTVGDPSRGIPLRTKHVKEKIGSILEKTDAPDEIKHAFINDPARTAKSAEHHVVISTRPLAVAGMTTGTHWKDQSCMNMEGGSYSYKLRNDSEHGTHVAFLVSHDDHTAFEYGEPSKPIARIAIKAHKDDAGDVIFRPETRAYGNSTDAFHRAVSQWSHESYPAKENQTYYKEDELYHDSGPHELKHLSKDTISDKIKHCNFDAHETNYSHSDIDHAISESVKNFRELKNEHHLSENLYNISELNDLATSHVAKIHSATHLLESTNLKHSVLNKLMANHGDKASTSAIINHVDSGNRLYTKIMSNPKLPDRVLDTISPNMYHNVRLARLTPRHIDKAVDSIISGDSAGRVFDHIGPKLSEDHINKIVKSGESSPILSQLVEHPKFNKESHDHLVTVAASEGHSYTKDLMERSLLRASPHATVEDAKKMASMRQYTRLSENTHIPDSEHEKLARTFIKETTSGIPNAKQQRHPGSAYGWEMMGTIPTHMSKHFTNEDYSKLAEHNYTMHFESPEHSNKFLDASEAKVKHLDDAITEHQEKFDEEQPDADFDPHYEKMVDELKNHIRNHAINIDSHVRSHAINDYGAGGISNHTEHRKARERLHVLDTLDHYHTANTSSRYDETEHYDEHVRDVHDLLNQAHEYSERNE